MSDKILSDQLNSDKPWAGRFTEPTDAFVEAFTASVGFDQRMYKQDIQGSIAHAQMLAHVSVLTEDECKQIVAGLKAIEADIREGHFNWSVSLEDLHMNIEFALSSKIGEVGKKLHTGRSRNDQVATDVRLYLRDEIDNIANELMRLLKGMLEKAEAEAETIMPGFTHLQIAQPVTFGHHVLAWCEMFLRDAERLQDCRKRVNVMPLGAAALAGTTFPIDRNFTAEKLGFDKAAANSLDAVSDRDFVIEFISCASVMMMHMSRIAEELVLWSSSLVNFIELSDSFCTGSSIMPQKKNPDVPELVRGKTGRVYGHLMNMLTLMKGQPLAYNKDNQEDKEPLFDTIDNLKGCLKIYAAMLPHINVNKQAMYDAASKGFSTATDLADYLVRNGVAFRDAHEVVGKAVRLGIDEGKDLSELTLEQLRAFSDAIKDDVFNVLTVEGSVAARNHLGGTAPEQVKLAVQVLRKQLI
ncbi:argininosuccinate lyase [Beggiatoa alba]|nr:argininosuccinate lyase [Beggiatoa alba]